jgi:hypothetical protein
MMSANLYSNINSFVVLEHYSYFSTHFPWSLDICAELKLIYGLVYLVVERLALASRNLLRARMLLHSELQLSSS